MRRLVLFLLTLVILAVVLDRGGAYVAGRVVAGNLASYERLDTDPSVSITGIPFLTQFAGGDYDHVVVTSEEVDLAGTDVGIDRVRLDAYDVTASRDFTTIRAERATASAVFDYDTIGRLLAADASYAGGGRLKIEYRIPEVDVTVGASSRPVVENGRLRLTDTRTEGDVPEIPFVDLDDLLDDVLDLDVPVGDLPYDLSVRGVDATKNGIRLRLGARNLSYTSR